MQLFKYITNYNVEEFRNNIKREDLYARDDNGDTLLMSTCYYETPTFARIILDLMKEMGEQERVNDVDKRNNSALHIACSSDCDKIVEMLLNVKDNNGNIITDVNIKNNLGDTPLHKSCVFNNAKHIDMLLNVPTIDIAARNIDGKTPLEIAFAKNSKDAIKIILKRLIKMKFVFIVLHHVYIDIVDTMIIINNTDAYHWS